MQQNQSFGGENGVGSNMALLLIYQGTGKTEIRKKVRIRKPEKNS